MDEDQYDEFGNYIGGNLESSSDESEVLVYKRLYFVIEGKRRRRKQ